ncbi:MAG TPA: AraC family transcriptional regulator [Puia sp.]|jgi:AraC-like DNA-binding protein|nr:AraC family transcriptional regulator [Puia sp.]
MPIAPDIYRRIVSAKLYIDGNFRERLDLDRLAREACLSRYHFHRLFTRIYRVTPHQYLTRKRIEAAQLGLAGQARTVTEVCNDVGFESIGSFSSLFKKEIGHAPASYRSLTHGRNRQVKDSPRSFIPHCFIETLTTKSNSQEAVSPAKS